MSIRFLAALFPRWPDPTSNVTEAEIASINGTLLHRFLTLAESEGTVPMIVLFPKGRDVKIKRVLEQWVPDYLDLGPCLERLDAAELTARDGVHFSPTANRQIARCLTPEVRDRLAQADSNRD